MSSCQPLPVFVSVTNAPRAYLWPRPHCLSGGSSGRGDLQIWVSFFGPSGLRELGSIDSAPTPRQASSPIGLIALLKNM